MRLLIIAIVLTTCAVAHGNLHRSRHNSNPGQFNYDQIFSRGVQHGRPRMRDIDLRPLARPFFRTRDAYNGMSYGKQESIPEHFMRNRDVPKLVTNDKQAPIPHLFMKNREVPNSVMDDKHAPIPQLYMRNRDVPKLVTNDKQAPIPHLFMKNREVPNSVMDDKHAPIPQLYMREVPNLKMNDKHAPIPQLYKGLDHQNSGHTQNNPCMRPCPMVYMPVCGNNGRTYSNDCEMEEDACRRRTRLFVARQGPC